jgi:hypothetical protein
MKNGKKKGFDVTPAAKFGIKAYRREIKKWRDDLRNIATGALQMQGIEDCERDNLRRALDSLLGPVLDGRQSHGCVDELVKIIGELPYAQDQAYALSKLWSAIGAAFIIGSRGIENPLTEKFREDEAAQSAALARSAKPRIKECDQIDEVIARHCAAYKNPKRAGNKSGIAEDILSDVNSDLARLRIKPFSKEALRKRIVLP